jgi:hypothetical protein
VTQRREQFAAALAGISYPAQRWQLVTWADFNAASAETCARLLALPERAYRSLADVISALAASAATGPGTE